MVNPPDSRRADREPVGCLDAEIQFCRPSLRNWSHSISTHLPTNQVGERSALVSPNNRLNQLLPVTTPGDQEHEASCPDQVSEEEHPSPNRQVVRAEGVVAVDELSRVCPQVISQPTHQIGRTFIELRDVTRPNRSGLASLSGLGNVYLLRSMAKKLAWIILNTKFCASNGTIPASIMR